MDAVSTAADSRQEGITMTDHATEQNLDLIHGLMTSNDELAQVLQDNLTLCDQRGFKPEIFIDSSDKVNNANSCSTTATMTRRQQQGAARPTNPRSVTRSAKIRAKRRTPRLNLHPIYLIPCASVYSSFF